MDSLDFEELAADFIRQLRGRRSQVGFSRRLQYKSNVAYLWESHRNWPTASKAFWAATRVGIDLRAGMERFYRDAPPWLCQVDLCTDVGVAKVLDDLRGDIPITELAEQTGCSRYAVARWLKGQTEPRLPDFFRLFEAASQRVLDFVNELVDITKMPSAATRWKELQATRKLASQTPWSPAVLLVMQTEAYRKLPKHKVGWIAERIGLPVAVEEECLALLSASGQIRMMKGRWQVVKVQTVDTRNDPDAGRRLKQWWANVGLEHLRNDGPGLFSFNVCSVSNRDLERLEEMHRAYYRAMRAVVAASEPPERVVVANLQLFALGNASQRG